MKRKMTTEQRNGPATMVEAAYMLEVLNALSDHTPMFTLPGSWDARNARHVEQELRFAECDAGWAALKAMTDDDYCENPYNWTPAR